VVVHPAPLFPPPRQRLPPQTAVPGQSALLLHASAAAVAQVSQKQFCDVKPGAVHFTPLVASDVVPVVAALNAICRLPTGASKPASGRHCLAAPESSN
jgi:hypothetical protein